MKCLSCLYNKDIKKLSALTLILLTSLLSAEPEKYSCTTQGFDGIPFVIDKELESIKFVNMVFKYDWKKHHNGYSAKNEQPKEPLHSSFTYKNYQKVRWFEFNKVVILTKTSGNEFVYICKAVT
ncbi:MAG: hypothetical protein VW418_06295 [Gammaproteobacteria bacterium]